MNSQDIFCIMENHDFVYYLIDHQEKTYCKIPKSYYGMCEKLRCCFFENKLFNITLESKTKNYKLIEFKEM